MPVHFKSVLLAVILTGLFSSAGLCMEPPGPGEIAGYRADGTLAERKAFMRILQNQCFHPALVERKILQLNAGKAAAYIQPQSLPYAAGLPSHGAPSIFILLIDFHGNPHTNEPAVFSSKIFGSGEQGEYPYESLKKYYQRSSYGALDIQGEVFGWYTARLPRFFYGTGRQSLWGMWGVKALIKEALRYYDPIVDFSRFDNDGDGVIDSQDECPDVPGPLELHGCPDRDGDKVPDYKDKCPDDPGPPEQGGCPFLDTDGDGIKDSEDHCPTVPGPPENYGCPYSDTDGDGVLDKDDRCPLTPGDLANNGCPVIKVEEAAVLKTAFENLEFQTGKAVIASSSYASLDELAVLLISKPTWKLKLSGHTDDVGSDESNMTLSKNRTQAVGKYLQSKGVAGSRLDMKWFGETMPKYDNTTPDGRQKNRRVEMEVVIE